MVTKMVTKTRQSESKRSHINNMGGVTLKSQRKKAHEVNSIKALERLKAKKPEKRVLLDLCAVSVTPAKANNNWTMIDTGRSQETDAVGLMKFGRYDFRPNGKVEFMYIDEFFDFFTKEFDDLLDLSEKYEETSGGGGGYNDGRVYTLGETSARISFRYFNPEKSDLSDADYKTGSKIENYYRQKINVKLTGDGLQYLRAKGNFMRYVLRLFTLFPCHATMYDAALDLFNYDQVPKYYSDLYNEGCYTGRAKLNVSGHSLNPTVYIGERKGSRTIMLYDKLQESRDADNSDEPELVEILESTGGNWFRLEQHYANDRREAEQAFGYIVYKIKSEQSDNWLLDTEARFIELLATMLKQNVEKKCRFLAERKKKYNNERIETDKKWGEILNAIETVEMDFAFNRPKLTLRERMKNYKHRFVGGRQLQMDIINELGKDGHMQFMMEVAQHYQKIADEENEKNKKK